MEKDRCPGCGAPYDGIKCRACLYKSIETDLCAKTVPPTPGLKRQKSPFPALLGLFVIFVVIALLMPGLRNWGIKLDAIEAINRTPEPIPGNPTVLFRQDPITVLVPETDSPSVSIWLYNHSKTDVVVVCKDITVNSYRMETAALSVYVPAGSAVKAALLELETLADEFTFSMEVKKSSGEFLFETAPIHLKERTAVYG